MGIEDTMQDAADAEFAWEQRKKDLAREAGSGGDIADQMNRDAVIEKSRATFLRDYKGLKSGSPSEQKPLNNSGNVIVVPASSVSFTNDGRAIIKP
jgi:hypothetical protein